MLSIFKIVLKSEYRALNAQVYRAENKYKGCPILAHLSLLKMNLRISSSVNGATVARLLCKSSPRSAYLFSKLKSQALFRVVQI